MGQRDLLRRALLLNPQYGAQWGGGDQFAFQPGAFGGSPWEEMNYGPARELGSFAPRPPVQNPMNGPDGPYSQQQDPKILMQEMLRQSALPGMDQHDLMRAYMGAGPQMSKFRQARIDSLRNSAQFGAPASRKSTDQQSFIDQLLLR